MRGWSQTGGREVGCTCIHQGGEGLGDVLAGECGGGWFFGWCNAGLGRMCEWGGRGGCSAAGGSYVATR